MSIWGNEHIPTLTDYQALTFLGPYCTGTEPVWYLVNTKIGTIRVQSVAKLKEKLKSLELTGDRSYVDPVHIMETFNDNLSPNLTKNRYTMATCSPHSKKNKHFSPFRENTRSTQPAKSTEQCRPERPQKLRLHLPFVQAHPVASYQDIGEIRIATGHVTLQECSHWWKHVSRDH